MIAGVYIRLKLIQIKIKFRVWDWGWKILAVERRPKKVLFV